MNGLAVEALGCRRGGRMVFERLGFALGAGEVGLVTGPNGSGKSSLLRIVGGLLMPFGGAVRRPPGGMAYLGEQNALDAERTLDAALGFWARLDGAGDPAARVAAALADLDLAPLAGVPVRMLSTGQRRRAALARVVASQAALWLLDEPANGLDDRSVARLEALIARHSDAGGIALVATHLPLARRGGAAIRLGGP